MTDKSASYYNRRQWLGLMGLLFLSGCASPPQFSEENWQKRVMEAPSDLLYAPHRDKNGLFFNPWMSRHNSGNWLEVLRWRLFMKNSTPPAGRDLPLTELISNDGTYLQKTASPDSLTNIGHATFALQWSGQVLLFDPFFSSLALIMPRDLPAAFGPEVFPNKTLVFISHNHYDHLDQEAVEILAGKQATFLCPLGQGDWLREHGAKQIYEMDWWQTQQVDGTECVFLPAQHWSNRFGQPANSSLWGSWLVQRNGRKIFFGGDSGYFIGYAEIGRRYPGIDLAVLPAGAYLPRWLMHYAHMNVQEMFQALRDLKARRLVPMHWGTIKLDDAPPAWPKREIELYLERNPGIQEQVRIMPPGDRLSL